MKRLLFAAAFAIASLPALAADVDVSINLGQPGFYGRIDVGGYPPPRVIYSQPRYIYRSAAHRAPIYLNVPPGHAKNWRKHCRHYNACGERVLFVRNDWYTREYVPHYQKQHAERRDDWRDDRRDERRHDRRHDRQDDRHDDRHDHHGKPGHDDDRGGDRQDHRGDKHGNDRGNGHNR